MINNTYKLYLLLIFIVSLYLQSINISENLLDLHSFRQTQTAISTYWFSQEGLSIKYLTPLFGYPWTIPFEFPTYQIFVYMISELLNINNLDLAGRLTSLLFYYLSFIPLYLILKSIKLSNRTIYIFYIITLSSPIFIFWSRTFMIESCALFFSLIFILMVILYEKNQSNKLLLGIFIFATISALTKITTFLIALIFLFLYFLLLKNIKELFTKKFILISIIVLASISLGIFWTKYTDSIKGINILASEIRSTNLNTWNFGTIEQRLNIMNYKQILHHILNNSILSILIPFLLFFKENRKLILISIITYIMSFMILFNLYFVHNYYWYANSIFLIIAISIGLSNLFKYLNNTILIHIIMLVCISINFISYFSYYYKIQNYNHSKDKIILISDFIKENTNKNDLIFIDGLDWNSSLSYYAQRKSIMLPNWEKDSITHNKFNKLITESLNSNNLTSIILCNNKRKNKEVLNFFKFNTYEKKSINTCLVFIKKENNNDI